MTDEPDQKDVANGFRTQLTAAQERIRELEHQVTDLSEQRDNYRTLYEAAQADPADLGPLLYLIGRPRELETEIRRRMREAPAEGP